jgi:hypothetical protein
MKYYKINSPLPVLGVVMEEEELAMIYRKKQNFHKQADTLALNGMEKLRVCSNFQSKHLYPR